jgi:UDP-galactopyranose mutase
MEIGILGAGLSGVSLAYVLQGCDAVRRIELLEEAPQAGGLCRSFPLGNLHYDVGPHIIFSKDTSS